METTASILVMVLISSSIFRTGRFLLMYNANHSLGHDQDHGPLGRRKIKILCMAQFKKISKTYDLNFYIQPSYSKWIFPGLNFHLSSFSML